MRWWLAATLLGCHASDLTAVPVGGHVIYMRVRDPEPRPPTSEPETIKLPNGAVDVLAPDDAASALGEYHCPTSGNEYWKPAPDVVAQADALLAVGLTEVGDSIARYNRRYIGIVARGTRAVCIDAVTVRATSRLERATNTPTFDWRRQAVPADVDMDVFFAIFDPTKNSFVAFEPHPRTMVCGVYSLDIDRDFIRVCGRDLRTDADECDPVTPDRVAGWHKLGAAYGELLERSLRSWILPGRDDSRITPRPAMRAAFAYKQAGEYDVAIRTYRSFLDRYGASSKLRILKEKAPELYAERLKYMALAYNELATTYLAAFRYDEAQSVYGELAADARFDSTIRSEALKNAERLRKALVKK